MRIYDISQEVFGCNVFPGDPAPEKEILSVISKDSPCNLSAFRMCAHNGTHVDAPYHFLQKVKTIDQVELEKSIGNAYVTEHNGIMTAQDAAAIMGKARRIGRDFEKRILIKGKAVVSAEAADVFAEEGIFLLGNESQTVGPEDAPMEVHLKLLGAEIVLLEGICLDKVPEGCYFLNAAPINLGGGDGAPCRAILVELD